MTSGAAGNDGILQGALEIDLEPGWKTYWRDPGAAGVPPELDISASVNIASAELLFPAPQRFDDGGTKWAGYRHSVVFPVRFAVKDPAQPVLIEAGVFLGICKTICIPVQGVLSVDPTRNPGAGAGVVQGAFAALPPAADQDFGVSGYRLEQGRLIVETALPDDAGMADLFVAGAHGVMFGNTGSQQENGRTVFSTPILAQPETIPAATIIHYTLVTDRGAVNGTLQIP